MRNADGESVEQATKRSASSTMITCQYEIWASNEHGKKMLLPCGHEARVFKPPKVKYGVRSSVFLCPEHREFVADIFDFYTLQKSKDDIKAEIAEEKAGKRAKKDKQTRSV